MEHLDVQLAHRLLRGQLDAAARVGWERHIRECARCHDLVAAERAMLTVLELGSESAAPAAPRVDHVLERVADAAPGGLRRRGHRAALGTSGLLVAAALVLLLVRQLGSQEASSAALAAELRISPELQEQVVNELPALAASWRA